MEENKMTPTEALDKIRGILQQLTKPLTSETAIQQTINDLNNLRGALAQLGSFWWDSTIQPIIDRLEGLTSETKARISDSVTTEDMLNRRGIRTRPQAEQPIEKMMEGLVKVGAEKQGIGIAAPLPPPQYGYVVFRGEDGKKYEPKLDTDELWNGTEPHTGYWGLVDTNIVRFKSNRIYRRKIIASEGFEIVPEGEVVTLQCQATSDGIEWSKDADICEGFSAISNSNKGINYQLKPILAFRRPIPKRQVEQRMCSVCAGSGNPVSGLKCVCGGKGTEEAEITGLRLMVIDLEKRLEQVAKPQASGEVTDEMVERLYIQFQEAWDDDKSFRNELCKVIRELLQHQRRDGLARLEKLFDKSSSVFLHKRKEGFTIEIADGTNGPFPKGIDLESALAQYEATQGRGK